MLGLHPELYNGCPHEGSCFYCSFGRVLEVMFSGHSGPFLSPGIPCTPSKLRGHYGQAFLVVVCHSSWFQLGFLASDACVMRVRGLRGAWVQVFMSL